MDAFAVRPAEGTLVTRGGHTMRGWNPATGAPLWTTTSENDDPPLSGDGSRFADKASEDAPVRVRDSATGNLIGVLPAEGWISAFSHDGTRLVTTKRVIDSETNRIIANDVTLWDVDRRVALRKLTLGEISLVDVVSGNLFVLQGASPGNTAWIRTFVVLDARNGDRLWFETISHSFPRHVFPVAGAPEVMLLDFEKRARIARCAHRRGRLAHPGRWAPRGGGGAGRGSRWRTPPPLNNQDDAILFLDPVTGGELQRIEGVGPVRDLRATPDGSKLVGAVQNDRFEGLRVWRAADGVLLQEIALDASPRKLVPIDQVRPNCGSRLLRRPARLRSDDRRPHPPLLPRPESGLGGSRCRSGS